MAPRVRDTAAVDRTAPTARRDPGATAGIALIALGLACWPSRRKPLPTSAAPRAMLVYNAMAGSYLAWLGLAHHANGWLLWPVIALHAAIAPLLIRTEAE